MIFLFNFINPLKGIQVCKVKQEMLDILVCEGFFFFQSNLPSVKGRF